ncbi:hypothetical protein E2C01_004253 [Portunus trituberculatus]|uniref:Uncharacterized protein n=1 Tax=Portunus trituberculatus TaxID=210409 RepID=A0A5B7CQX3_PORTR|nr:hypothetical protein [Portunus trituberculatus]
MAMKRGLKKKNPFLQSFPGSPLIFFPHLRAFLAVDAQVPKVTLGLGGGVEVLVPDGEVEEDVEGRTHLVYLLILQHSVAMTYSLCPEHLHSLRSRKGEKKAPLFWPPTVLTQSAGPASPAWMVRWMPFSLAASNTAMSGSLLE